MKLIDLLLRLYPGEFRARYGKQMREFHDQRVQENAGWPRIVGDHVSSALQEQVQSAGPDVKYAMRGMLRRPGFAAVIILTIAVGIGANAAIFSVVNGILLRPLPYRDVERVVVLGHEPPHWLVSEPQYAIYREKVRSFASLAGYTTIEGNLATTEDAERVAMSGVTTNFFATVGVQPMLGRAFSADEAATRPSPVAILSHDVWQRHFQGDSSAIGKRFTINGIPRTVIGVMPQHFDFPSKNTKVWLPTCSQRTCASLTTLQPDTLDGFANHYLFVVGRLRDGFTIDQARGETGILARQIVREHPGNFDPRNPLTPKLGLLRDQILGPTRPYLFAMLGAVGVVLLVVCANVASLLLSRGEARRREMSLRMALGASSRRLVTQLLTEATVLAAIGGIAGLGLARAGNRALVAMAPPSLPRLDEIRVDWLVAAFGLVVSVGAGLVFGIVPALRASSEDPAEALKSAGKGASHSGGTNRARRMLVVAEVALAMVLLSGAGMLTRSLIHLHRQGMGFDTSNALTAKVSVSGGAYTNERTIQFFQELTDRARQIRGVQAVGAARWLPVVDQGGSWDIIVEGKTFPQGTAPSPVPQEVTPNYFAAIGLKLLQGRDFSDADRAGAPLVGVVSESFVKKIWDGESALGRRFRLGGRDSTQWVTVIGVVSDFKPRGFTDTPAPTMYFAHAQAATSSYYVSRSMSLVLRTSPGINPLSLGNPIRAAARALDPGVPVSSVMTLDALVGTSTAQRRFSTTLIAGFALLALLLAGIGIYGVISYAVSERTFEIGIRMALGAERGEVMGLVVGDGVKLTVIGIAIGAVGSAALARVMSSLLVGAPPVDFVTLGGVAAVLALVAVGASAMPARRASSVNPTEALRQGA
jgi:putative ABC transport system permease protein